MAHDKDSGNDGKVLVGTTDLKITQWSKRKVNKREEVTNSETAQVGSVITRETLLTQHHYEGSVEADYSIDASPFDDPPDLEGVDNITLYLYEDATRFWTFTASVTNVAATHPVVGKIHYSFDWASEGSWTAPTY